MSPSVQKKKIKDTWDESLPVFFFCFFLPSQPEEAVECGFLLQTNNR